jgi:hypothetical protein
MAQTHPPPAPMNHAEPRPPVTSASSPRARQNSGSNSDSEGDLLRWIAKAIRISQHGARGSGNASAAVRHAFNYHLVR